MKYRKDTLIIFSMNIFNPHAWLNPITRVNITLIVLNGNNTIIHADSQISGFQNNILIKIIVLNLL